MRSPVIFPTFAEYRPKPYFDDFLYDTGDTMRGLLPFPDVQTRTLLRNYSGPATVMNARTVCTRPQFLEGGERYVSLERGYSLSGKEGVLRVQGNFTVDENVAPQYLRKSNFNLYLNCTAPLPVWKDDEPESSNAEEPEWTTSICNSYSGDPYRLHLPSDLWPVESNEAKLYIVLNTTGNFRSWWDATEAVPSYYGLGWYPVTNETQGDGEWLKLRQALIGPPVTLAMSFCWYVHKSNDMLITAYSDSNRTEALIGWNEDEEWYDTTEVRARFGLDSSPSGMVDDSPDKFGQLTMERPAIDLKALESIAPIQLPGLTKGNDESLGSLINLDLFSTYYRNASLFMCSRCFRSVSSDYGGEQMAETNYILAAIFNHILRQTRRPALAIQTLMTILTMMPYYDQLPGFRGVADATYNLFVQMLAPASWFGFKIVLTLLGVHLLLILTIVVWFSVTAGRSNAGFLGSSWISVAQVASHPEVASWLGSAVAMDDGGVKRLLRNSEREKGVVLTTGRE